MTSDKFSKPVVRKLGERAAFICSNPECHKLTSGPDSKNAQKSKNIGRAAHITAASPGGPRYDRSLSPTQRSGIRNGVWLCASCGDLIDKNGGLDYPADILRRWKNDHEVLIKECLEGTKNVVFQFRSDKSDVKIARKILKFFEQRGALFQPYSFEVGPHVIESVKEMRTFLTAVAAETSPDSGLEELVDSIGNACRHFMNTTSPQITPQELSFALGAFRKIVTILLNKIAAHYEIKVQTPLKKNLPQD